jgi:flagellar protein FliS
MLMQIGGHRMEFLTEDFVYQKNSKELTSLLFEALLTNLYSSIEDIDKKDYLQANSRLQKANDILQRLGVGLNYSAGIIADQLDHLYNFLADSLIQANIRKDKVLIEEIIGIVKLISDPWNEIVKKNPTVNNHELRKRVNLYEKNIKILNNEVDIYEEGNYK